MGSFLLPFSFAKNKTLIKEVKVESLTAFSVQLNFRFLFPFPPSDVRKYASRSEN